MLDSSDRISLALAHSAFTSDSFIFSHCFSCSICLHIIQIRDMFNVLDVNGSGKNNSFFNLRDQEFQIENKLGNRHMINVICNDCLKLTHLSKSLYSWLMS